MKRLTPSLLILAGLSLRTLPVYGAHEFVPMQERAQGQSLLGASQLNDSLYSNPAASSFTQVYTIDGAYGLGKNFGASVLDTKSSAFGAGLGYFRRAPEGATDVVQGLKLSVMGRATDTIGIGVAGKALWGPGNDGGRHNLKDVDAGMLVRLTPVSLGLTFRNLFGGNQALDQNPEWGFGVSYSYESSFILSAAALGDMKNVKPYQYGFGAEYVSSYYFSLKGGYRIQPEKKLSFWSGGVSFLAPKISFHYSVEFPTEPNKKPEHLLGTTVLL